jgi:glycosyltransferase involved in cell wall biosynthesis
MGVKYLLTEQWTVYLEEAKPGFRDLPFFSQYFISKIISEAYLVLPVSEYLAKAIKRRWPFVTTEVVPNVVNSKIFFPGNEKSESKLNLIHVSTLTYQKDPEALISAAEILKNMNFDFSLSIIGPPNKNIRQQILDTGLENNVFILKEMPQHELANFIRRNDALILYSRYETFGCVLIEANACGIPVIVPNTQLMHEIIKDGVNGILVHPSSPSALAEAIIGFSKNRIRFSPEIIAKEASEKYSYKRIGKMYADIYNRFVTD